MPGSAHAAPQAIVNIKLIKVLRNMFGLLNEGRIIIVPHRGALQRKFRQARFLQTALA
jgi:hypothetical protein